LEEEEEEEEEEELYLRSKTPQRVRCSQGGDSEHPEEEDRIRRRRVQRSQVDFFRKPF